MNSCIDTNIDVSETDGIGTITLSNYGIGEWDAKLLPFRTRLSALNVKSDLEDKEGGILKIIIPIWRNP
jgi:hypothetical protein